MRDVAKTPALQKVLLQKIELEKQEVRNFKAGHVIVGRVQLEGAEDSETIQSQMIIFEDGYFSDAVADLSRPIAFRMLGYHPLDVMIPAGATPDDLGAIDLGTIRMEKCAPSEFRKAVGKISVPEGIDPSSVQILIYLLDGRENSPHNGTERGRKHAPPIEARVDKSGGVSAAGLTEGEYYATFNGEGVVRQVKTYQVTPDKDLDLGRIRLDKPVQILLEYIVAEGSAGTFDPGAKETAIILGGAKWKSRRTTEWDLEFVQSGSTIQFNSFYFPCALVDLGEGTLDDFIKTDFRQAKLDPRRVPFTSGHVYLLNHKQARINHVVLFRVEVQQPSADKGSRVQPGDK